MITELNVKNYRSLKDVKLPLGRLTVLIGANGSGKSNILDVLRLVKALGSDGQQLSSQFPARGGYKQIVWGGDSSQRIEISLSWNQAARNGTGQAYSLHFGHHVETDLDAEFTHEYLSITEQEGVVRSSSSEYKVRGENKSSVSGVNPEYSVVYAVGRPRSWPRSNLVESMRGWTFHRFDPQLMRRPQPVRKELQLTESGDNLSTVVHTLFSDANPALPEIVDTLRACVPTVEELRSPIVGDGETAVHLKERSVPTAIGSWGLSDGTLLALALATALLTPEPPSLLALEAPDVELHPNVMETLAEMLVLASQRTQVIATTHSPSLLDYLPTESFVVVDKVDGATTCTPLAGKRAMNRVADQLGAGKAWVAGHIGGVP